MNYDQNIAAIESASLRAADPGWALPNDDGLDTNTLRGIPSEWMKKVVRVAVTWMWGFLQRATTAKPPRKLRVCENVSLGDRRFLALVQVENQRFLIGGAANSISMLACLEKPTSLSEAPEAPMGRPL